VLLAAADAEVDFGAVEGCFKIGARPLEGVELSAEGRLGCVVLYEDSAADGEWQRGEVRGRCSGVDVGGLRGGEGESAMAVRRVMRLRVKGVLQTDLTDLHGREKGFCLKGEVAGIVVGIAKTATEDGEPEP
jgi:hypothetical protein